MSKPPVRDVTKLPKWAQNEISRLTADLKHYKDAAMEMETGDTNVFQQDILDRRPMKRDSSIIFVTDDTEFQIGFRSGELQVMTLGRGKKDRLAVRPQSSNVIVLEGWGR